MWHHAASRDQVINAYSVLVSVSVLRTNFLSLVPMPEIWCRLRLSRWWPSAILDTFIGSVLAPAVNNTCWSLSLCSAAMRPNNSNSNIRPNNVNNRPNVADVDWLVDNSYFGHFVVHIVVYELYIFVSNNHCAQCK